MLSNKPDRTLSGKIPSCGSEARDIGDLPTTREKYLVKETKLFCPSQIQRMDCFGILK